MKYPVTETWANAYTLSGLAPGSELAIKPSGAAVYIVIGDSASQTVSAEIVLIEGDIDLPV